MHIVHTIRINITVSVHALHWSVFFFIQLFSFSLSLSHAHCRRANTFFGLFHLIKIYIKIQKLVAHFNEIQLHSIWKQSQLESALQKYQRYSEPNASALLGWPTKMQRSTVNMIWKIDRYSDRRRDGSAPIGTNSRESSSDCRECDRRRNNNDKQKRALNKWITKQLKLVSL